MPFIKKFILLNLCLFLLTATIVGSSLLWIYYSTDNLSYSDIDNIPPKNVGLVLGTSPWSYRLNKTTGKRIKLINPFYVTRIQAAAALYKAGKIQHIIVSGDNRQKDYNEPQEMLMSLQALDVDPNDVTLDYAGFRTIDSILRAKNVFDIHSYTIISQDWHNRRALYIAKQYDIDAIAFNAQNPQHNAFYSTLIREVPAKLYMLLDVHLFATEPKFNGPKEPIFESK